MDNKVRISIIIPVYNVELYLKECLDSIIAQSFTDYELILVDDGSTDKSGLLCDHYAETDKRIKVVHQTNQGQSAARNKGIEIARGEWIHFVDSDDIIHPQMLELLYTAATKEGVKYSACNRETFDDPNKITYREYSGDYRCIDIDEQTALTLRKECTAYWTPYASLVHSEIIKKNQFQPGRIYEDNALCFKWIHEAGKIVLLEPLMYFYRNNPNGTMNQKFSIKKLDYLWALSEQIVYYKENGYYSLLNAAFEDYVGAAIKFYYDIGNHLKDARLQRSVLRKTRSFCKEYRKDLRNYENYIDRLEKRLHPMLHKVKKAIRARML